MKPFGSVHPSCPKGKQRNDQRRATHESSILTKALGHVRNEYRRQRDFKSKSTCRNSTPFCPEKRTRVFCAPLKQHTLVCRAPLQKVRQKTCVNTEPKSSRDLPPTRTASGFTGESGGFGCRVHWLSPDDHYWMFPPPNSTDTNQRGAVVLSKDSWWFTSGSLGKAKPAIHTPYPLGSAHCGRTIKMTR